MAEITVATEVPKVEMSTQEMLQAIQALRPDSPEAQAIFDASRAMVQFREEGQEELRKTAIAAKAAVAELQRANTEILIARFRREGKITNATERFWRPIFEAKPLSGSSLRPEDTLTFSMEKDGIEVDQLAHYAELVIMALNASPALFSLSEILMGQTKEDDMTPEQRAFAKNKLKQTDEDIAKYGGAQSEVN